MRPESLVLDHSAKGDFAFVADNDFIAALGSRSLLARGWPLLREALR